VLITFRKILKHIPTLLLSLLLGLIVWGFAVTSADPVEERVFPRSIPIELIGQDPTLILTSESSLEMTLTLSAPKSVLDKLENNQVEIQALVDLSTLPAGTHTLPVVVNIDTRPLKIIANNPTTITVTLEPLASVSLPIRLITSGEIEIGFQGGPVALSQISATISGPKSLVEKVKEITANLDVSQTRENINRSLLLMPIDENGNQVSGLTVSPERVTVTQSITQKGGYRTVVVKVLVTGQVANGYRLTNISAFPAVVTVFSTNPVLVDQLPGYVETFPLSLVGLKDDVDVRLDLILPAGVSVVGDQSVQVQVGVATIEGSVTLINQPVTLLNLAPGLMAEVSPLTVDVIVSGPLPLLDQLTQADLRVTLDLSGLIRGTYQLIPTIELRIAEIRVESILPGSVEVQILDAPSPTPTLRR
jgi:YbbR domain-containing protein